jgi:hypothetical protein
MFKTKTTNDADLKKILKFEIWSFEFVSYFEFQLLMVRDSTPSFSKPTSAILL